MSTRLNKHRKEEKRTQRKNTLNKMRDERNLMKCSWTKGKMWKKRIVHCQQPFSTDL